MNIGKNYLTPKKTIVTIIVFLLIMVGFVFQELNPINKWLKQSNTNILASAKPELFEIKLNLNDLGLKMLPFEELTKIYSSQKCYLNKYYSNEELANSSTSDEQDFDKDGLSNSIELIYNSNPREKQTQPNLDDNIQYIDSKSPFNSREIKKDKNFYVTTSLIGEEGQILFSELERMCNEGYWFFDIYHSERIFQPTELKINNNPTKNSFELFSNKEVELLKNRELDIFLKIASKNKEIYQQELITAQKNLDEINQYIIEPKNSQKYLSLYDYYNKIVEIYKSESLSDQIELYKEILYIIKNL
jgi:hypothetical protein